MFPVVLTGLIVAALAWLLWSAAGRRLYQLLTQDEERELRESIADVRVDLEELETASDAAAATLRRHYEARLRELNRKLARIEARRHA